MTKSNGNYCFDAEVFPNFFSCTFVPIDSDDVFSFVIHESRDDRETLMDFLAEVKGLIGFNSIGFDNPLLRMIIRHYQELNLNSILFGMAQRLISPNSYYDDEVRGLRYPKKSEWRDLDLMKLLAADVKGLSLKQLAVNMKWHKIQDLPLSYDSHIFAEQIPMILDYNLNDVQITQVLFQKLQPEIQLRKEIRRVYGVEVSSASDSKIANLLLEHMMGLSNGELKELREKRTSRESVKIADCIPHNIEFRAPELCALLEKLTTTIVYRSRKYHYQAGLKFAGKEYQLGIGGLHSEDHPADFRSDEQMLIRDADVSSYYPSIMLKLNIRPAHLDERFSQILNQMTEDRLSAKHNGDKTRADALKITINSIFGKLGSDKFWLEDALAFLRVTIAGQLYLLMLVEMLHDAGIETLSANTDGIVCKIGRNQEADYDQTCILWQQKTGFELEFTDYTRYVRRDVNSYISIKADGKTKEKGIFAEIKDLKKGFKFPIIQQCIYHYFVNGKPIETTLNQSRDILDFSASQKIGGQFQAEYHTVNGIQTLQKTNRYAIGQGGALMKRNRSTQKLTAIQSGETVMLLNDLDSEIGFESYQVDFDFYRKEIEKIIEQIEPKIQQLCLF